MVLSGGQVYVIGRAESSQWKFRFKRSLLLTIQPIDTVPPYRRHQRKDKSDRDTKLV
jgi:hypothetical protein